MRVVQLLIDGFHPKYTQKELLDFDHVVSKYAGFVELDSVFPRLKRLNSPYMWGRTLAGPEFPRTLEGYNPNHTNLQSASDQGYLSIDPCNWIWNKLSKLGIPSFSFPYYLLEAVPISNIITDDNSLATVYARDYSSKDYRLIEGLDDSRIMSSGRVYHAVCDNFDYNYGLDKKEVAYLRDTWKNYSAENQSDFNYMIKFIEDRLVPKVEQDLQSNRSLIKDEILVEMSNKLSSLEDSYCFLGFVESDAIEHYALPYPMVFKIFRNLINEVVDYVNEHINPDILIIHGDHNMVTSDHLQKPYKAEFDKDSKHYYTHKAGYNHFPMYTDHGNRVGGYVFYKDDFSKNLAQKLLESDELVIDRLRDWIINEVFRKESDA